MNFDDIRHGLETLKDSFADGWDRLRRSAAGALTRFRPGETTQLPAREEIDDVLYLSGQRWAMLGGDVFEDDNRLVVRIEAPGMEKDDFDVQVSGDHLVIRGEKRFERSVALPVMVKNDEARATYKNGVLKVELPKVQPGRPSAHTVKVD